MDTEILKQDLINLSVGGKTLDVDAIPSAIRLAGYQLAHHVDIPELQLSDEFTVSADTPNYTSTLTLGGNIDRITVATFVGGSVKKLLREVDIRTYDNKYRGSGTKGTPYKFCYYAKQFWLYYIPNLSGTVYFRCQKIFSNFNDLDDNYYPLVYLLAKRNLNKEGSPEWFTLNREAKELISSLKGRVRPYKAGIGMSRHREERVQKLSEMHF